MTSRTMVGIVGLSLIVFAPAGASAQQQSTFTNFITRSEDKLMEGDKEFRFISINCPILHFIESAEDLPDPYEQEDAIQTIVQMGGTVVRDYVLTVTKTNDSPELAAKRMITGPNTFNEEAFVALDKVLELCNSHGIRIIIPFIDPYEYFGGIPQFEALRGKSGFYTDPQLRQDFKDVINYLVNRTNVYTGIKYKDDKAILAWETGNELNNPDEWCRDIAAHIKSIDPNHLVMDGAWRGLRPDSLADPNIDIVSDHYYPWIVTTNFSSICDTERNIAKGKKVFIVGEFGQTTASNVKELLDTVVDNGTSGALIWAMRPHNRNGGFYHNGPDFHWPGFASGQANEETAILDLIRNNAFKIRGLPVPAKSIPSAPFIVSGKSYPQTIAWRGSTGAEKYDIERADSPNGPWIVVGADITDDIYPFKSFRDVSAVEWRRYYYRMKAKNVSGTSPASNVIGPITFTGLTDEMKDFSKMFQHTDALRFEDSKLMRTLSRFENIVYHSATNNMASFEMDSLFFPSEAVVDFKFYVSKDGADYNEFAPAKKDLLGSWKMIKYSSNSLPAGTRYLKIEFRNTSINPWTPQISRLLIDYRRDKEGTVIRVR